MIKGRELVEYFWTVIEHAEKPMEKLWARREAISEHACGSIV